MKKLLALLIVNTVAVFAYFSSVIYQSFYIKERSAVLSVHVWFSFIVLVLDILAVFVVLIKLSQQSESEPQNSNK